MEIYRAFFGFDSCIRPLKGGVHGDIGPSHRWNTRDIGPLYRWTTTRCRANLKVDNIEI